MNDGETSRFSGERGAWIRNLRRENELQEDTLAPVFDSLWGVIEETHRSFVEALLSRLPPEGRVLDAACGTGKYFQIVLDGGRQLLGVDHAGAYLARAAEKFPQVQTEKHDLQDLPYRSEFDGVMCVDAMEMVPPEDWPVVLERFHRALRRAGRLYLTVELVPAEQVRALNEKARRSGLPLVDGEVIWDEEPDSYYHYYPGMKEVHAWVADAGFEIEQEVEGPWEDEGFAYHHLLARVAPGTG